MPTLTKNETDFLKCIAANIADNKNLTADVEQIKNYIDENLIDIAKKTFNNQVRKLNQIQQSKEFIKEFSENIYNSIKTTAKE